MYVSQIVHPAAEMSSNNLHGILNSKQVCFFRQLGKCPCPVDFVHFDCSPALEGSETGRLFLGSLGREGVQFLSACWFLF